MATLGVGRLAKEDTDTRKAVQVRTKGSVSVEAETSPPLPHQSFVGRWAGEGASRRKHNGRLRRLPHRGRLTAKNRRDLEALEWYFSTDGGLRVFVSKVIDLYRKRSN